MLFIVTGIGKPNTQQERLARRMQWKYPKGVKIIAEIWPVGGEFNVVTIAEADSVAPISLSLTQWADLMDFTVTPAMTAEDGIRLYSQ